MQAKVDMSQLTDHLREVEASIDRLGDLTPALDGTVAKFRAMVDAAFRSSTAPDGKPWKALSPKYLERKLQQGYSSKPLIRRGARGLQGQVTIQAVKDGIEFGIGPLVPYGVFHQFGGNKIPQRSFLPFEGTPDAPRIMRAPKVRVILEDLLERVTRWVFDGRV